MIGWWAVGLGFAVGLARFELAPRTRMEADPGDPVGFGRLLIVALSAGLGLAEGWDLAARYSGGMAAREATELARRALTSGLAAELRKSEGSLAPIASSISQAQLVGAPLLPAIRGAVQRLRSESRARRIERIRTLSVKLTLPVSLLLLPGFLLVVVLPHLLDGVAGVLAGGGL